MKTPRLLMLFAMLSMGTVLFSNEAQAQFYEVYYPGAYYAPAPVPVYQQSYYAAPVTTYYAAPAYYAAPVTTYYAAPGYYAPPAYRVPSRVQYYPSGRIKETFYYGNDLKLKVKYHPAIGVYDTDWDD